MRAMRIHAYSETLGEPMRLDEVPEPRPGAGQLLVRVKAAGVNPIDLSKRRGLPTYTANLTLPCIIGSECAGEVVEAGEGVSGFSGGERVFGKAVRSEAYAEFALLKADTATVFSDATSFAEGAALPVCFHTAWHALVIQVKAGAGETVLVQGGAGGVGIATIQLAKALGCRVFTTVSSEEKAGFCREYGADETINYREENFAARCKELTGGRGVDVIVELAACDNIDRDLDAITFGGRIVIVGMGTGKGPMAELRIPGITRNGPFITGISARTLEAVLPEALRRMAPMWEAHKFRVPAARAFPLGEVNTCHEVLGSGKFMGKLVLIP
jgi:NADPH2:quinone reductase